MVLLEILNQHQALTQPQIHCLLMQHQMIILFSTILLQLVMLHHPVPPLMISMILQDLREQRMILGLMNIEIPGLAQAVQTGVQHQTGTKDMSPMRILNHP